jgi:hypothetical protein
LALLLEEGIFLELKALQEQMMVAQVVHQVDPLLLDIREGEANPATLAMAQEVVVVLLVTLEMEVEVEQEQTLLAAREVVEQVEAVAKVAVMEKVEQEVVSVCMGKAQTEQAVQEETYQPTGVMVDREVKKVFTQVAQEGLEVYSAVVEVAVVAGMAAGMAVVAQSVLFGQEQLDISHQQTQVIYRRK